MTLEMLKTSAAVAAAMTEQRAKLEKINDSIEEVEEKTEENLFDDDKCRELAAELASLQRQVKLVEKRIVLLEKRHDELVEKEEQHHVLHHVEKSDALQEAIAKLYGDEYVRAAYTLTVIAALHKQADSFRVRALHSMRDAGLNLEMKFAPALMGHSSNFPAMTYSALQLPNFLNKARFFWMDERSNLGVNLPDLAALIEAKNPAEFLQDFLDENPLPASALQPVPTAPALVEATPEPEKRGVKMTVDGKEVKSINPYGEGREALEINTLYAEKRD